MFSTSAIVDGKVEKLFQTLGTWNGQAREQAILSRIPLLERSLLVGHRHVLQLDNSSLFYDIHWASYFSILETLHLIMRCTRMKINESLKNKFQFI